MMAIIHLAQGNPGALKFLMELMSTEHMLIAIPIAVKIDRCNILGTDLYVLWSDLCNKDMSLVNKLCLDCPDDILINACSKQDYSGRELVKKYLVEVHDIPVIDEWSAYNE
jgi:hypothetical protein